MTQNDIMQLKGNYLNLATEQSDILNRLIMVEQNIIQPDITDGSLRNLDNDAPTTSTMLTDEDSHVTAATLLDINNTLRSPIDFEQIPI